MKRKILIVFMLLWTGCFGEIGKGYITKTCTKQEQANEININTNVILKSNQGNLVSLVITEKYETENDIISIINSKKSEANIYQSITGITTNIEDNIFTYNIDVPNANDLIIERFNIKKEVHKMIKFYEENGYKCK